VLNKPAVKENGTSRAPLDEATRQKAESNFPMYYEYIDEPDPMAQGTAPFN
jgi:hypothetical protein